MKGNLVRSWFGNSFTELDPLLQKLHLYGGELSGKIDIKYGAGLAGIIGKRLAKKMQLPEQGIHQLVVTISHTEQGLHWDRAFDDGNLVRSLFIPVKGLADGYWLEVTKPLEMKLTVDIIDGGWYWRCLSVAFLGIPIPLWLIPKAKAFKIIENGKYNFHVAFSLPFLGRLVSYQGVLDAKYNDK